VGSEAGRAKSTEAAPGRAAPSPGRDPAHGVAGGPDLASAIGNQAVLRALRVAPPDDPAEVEADRVADALLGAAAGPAEIAPAAAGLQRKCTSCTHEEEEVHRSPLPAPGTSLSAGSFAHPPGGGHPLPPALREFFEPRFGADFGHVRVHTGAEAADAARAVHARAYTRGSDIVFGAHEYRPQEAEGRRLLAHELTHVVQQDRGSGHALHRKASPAPAPAAAPPEPAAPAAAPPEREEAGGRRGAARAREAAAASGSEDEAAPPRQTRATRAIVVEEDAAALRPGQMRREDFLAALRREVCATADEGMAGTGRTSQGCPWIEFWFSFYAGRSAAHLERALRRFAPESAGARDAGDLIRALAARVRRSVDRWARTGEIGGLPEGVPADIPAAGAAGRVLFFAGPGGATAANPAAVRHQLGAGRPLDGGVRSRMESAFGESFSGVRTHIDAGATRLAQAMNASAFTVGEHVAFAAGQYRPGTIVGDALIAHELAHTLQQGSASGPAEGGAARLEHEADAAAAGAVVALWQHEEPGLGERVPEDLRGRSRPARAAGLRLQMWNCGGDRAQAPAPRQSVVPDLSADLVDRLRPACVANATAQTRQAAVEALVAWARSRPSLGVDWGRVDWIRYDAANSTTEGSETDANDPAHIKVKIGPRAFSSVANLYSTFRHELVHVVEHQSRPRSEIMARGWGAQEVYAYLWELEHQQETGLARPENWGIGSPNQSVGLTRVVDGLLRSLGRLSAELQENPSRLSQAEQHAIEHRVACAMTRTPRQVVLGVFPQAPLELWRRECAQGVAAPQRKAAPSAPAGTAVSAPDSPAEREADRVAETIVSSAAAPSMPAAPETPVPVVRAEVPPRAAEADTQRGGSGRAGAFLVADDAAQVGAGQIRREAFLAALRREVCATADEGMAGTGRTSQGCPWIEFWFAHYADKSVAHLERAVRRFAPESAGAADARDLIRVLAARVRRSVDRWARTGEIGGLPEGVPLDIPAAGAAGLLFSTAPGGATASSHPAAVRHQLGPGAPLEGGLRARMESAFGESFGHVRAHTDPGAARLAGSMNASAFTVGEHVAFAEGHYRPGTPAGDALIAHELAHTLQQGRPPAHGIVADPASTSGLEREADTAAAGAVVALWGDADAGRAARMPAPLRRQPQLRPGRGLRLQMSNCGATPPRTMPVARPPESEHVDQDLYDRAVASLRPRVGPDSLVARILTQGRVNQRVPNVHRVQDPAMQPPFSLTFVFDLEIASDPQLARSVDAAAAFDNHPQLQTRIGEPPDLVITRLLRIVVRRPTAFPPDEVLGQVLVHEGVHMRLAMDELMMTAANRLTTRDSTLPTASHLTGAAAAFARYTAAAQQSPHRAPLAAALSAELARVGVGSPPPHSAVVDRTIDALLEERLAEDERFRAYPRRRPVDNLRLADGYLFELLARESRLGTTWPRSPERSDMLQKAAALLDDVVQRVAPAAALGAPSP
jgi:hypothetical protein